MREWRRERICRKCGRKFIADRFATVCFDCWREIQLKYHTKLGVDEG